MTEPIVWTTPSGVEYRTQDELVAIEGHGWAVVAVLDNEWGVAVYGIWPTKREARNAMNRLKNRDKRRQEYDSTRVLAWKVRPVWKEEAHR